MTTVEVDGIRFPARYIGKGQYSKVYQVGSRVVYYTRGDCSKEVLAMFQYKRIAHLPELIRHNDIVKKVSYGGKWGTVYKEESRWYVFSSPYYRNVTKKDRSAYELMRLIQRSADRYRQALYLRGERGIYLMQSIIDGMKEDKQVPNSIVRVIQVIVDIASNCGDDVYFDFKKRNFGVNEYGTLIFRDPFYVYSGE